MTSHRPCNLGPVPETPAEQLDKCFTDYIACTEAEAIFEFGSYTLLTAHNQADATGLLSLRPLLLSLAACQPQLRFAPTALQESLCRVDAKTRTVLNKSKWPRKYWAGFAAKRVIVLAAHLRNLLPRTYRHAQLAAKLTPELLLELDSFLDAVAKHTGVLDREAEGPPPPKVPRRLLARHSSACSSISMPSVPPDSPEANDEQGSSSTSAKDFFMKPEDEIAQALRDAAEVPVPTGRGVHIRYTCFNYSL